VQDKGAAPIRTVTDRCKSRAQRRRQSIAQLGGHRTHRLALEPLPQPTHGARPRGEHLDDLLRRQHLAPKQLGVRTDNGLRGGAHLALGLPIGTPISQHAALQQVQQQQMAAALASRAQGLAACQQMVGPAGGLGPGASAQAGHLSFLGPSQPASFSLPAQQSRLH
jgi:hypothetical protein